MNLDNFWNLIDIARRAPHLDGRIEILRQRLSECSVPDVESFHRHYEQQLLRAYRWDLWGAAHLINEGCDHDGFLDFCNWLISEGQATFELALRDPDSLAGLPMQYRAELKLLGFVAPAVYEQRSGQELERDPAIHAAVPAGEEWSEAQLPVMFPRLLAKYWNGG